MKEKESSFGVVEETIKIPPRPKRNEEEIEGIIVHGKEEFDQAPTRKLPKKRPVKPLEDIEEVDEEKTLIAPKKPVQAKSSIITPNKVSTVKSEQEHKPSSIPKISRVKKLHLKPKQEESFDLDKELDIIDDMVSVKGADENVQDTLQDNIELPEAIVPSVWELDKFNLQDEEPQYNTNNQEDTYNSHTKEIYSEETKSKSLKIKRSMGRIFFWRSSIVNIPVNNNYAGLTYSEIEQENKHKEEIIDKLYQDNVIIDFLNLDNTGVLSKSVINYLEGYFEYYRLVPRVMGYRGQDQIDLFFTNCIHEIEGIYYIVILEGKHLDTSGSIEVDSLILIDLNMYFGGIYGSI